MNASGVSRWKKRLISGLVLGAATIILVWKGGLYFLGLLAALATILLYEWVHLSLRSQHKYILYLLGLFYIGLTMLVFYTIRQDFPIKMSFLFVTMIWASDTGAYLFGKSIGGPKMTPNISPNKTWAGFAGAMIAPAIAGAIFILVYDWVYHVADGHDMFEVAFIFIIFGATIGLVGQAGDLLISLFKRHVSVKDSGTLIPGHGGLLDRMDAMMLSAPVFLCFISRFFNEIPG
jgi:phosphatidate cytidylyltransferase